MLGPTPPPSAARGVDWALASTVLAGDFLLSQASDLVARSAPAISWAFADWLAELDVMLRGRFSTIPDLLNLKLGDEESLDANPLLRGQALAAAIDAGTDALRRALKAIEDLPDGIAARILREFIITVAAPLTSARKQ
jgi:hypothetical protein